MRLGAAGRAVRRGRSAIRGRDAGIDERLHPLERAVGRLTRERQAPVALGVRARRKVHHKGPSIRARLVRSVRQLHTSRELDCTSGRDRARGQFVRPVAQSRARELTVSPVPVTAGVVLLLKVTRAQGRHCRRSMRMRQRQQGKC
eukprot:7241107-Prymnesium_polylepis.1